MKKINIYAIAFIVLLSLVGCTTYDGAAYLKGELGKMKCVPVQPSKGSVDFELAKSDCIKSTVNDEYFKGGVSEATIEWIEVAHRNTYQECMAGKGFSCSREIH